MNKVAIVDDHPMVRVALRMLLVQEGYEVVAEAGNGVDVIVCIKKQMPDFVILDLDIPQINGLEVIRCIAAVNLPVSFLVFTAQDFHHNIMNCMPAGARGYVAKAEELGDLIKALRTVQSGSCYFPSFTNAASDPISETELINLLSQREMDIFRYLTQGVNNRIIARRMSLSEKTISTYKARVMEKLKVDNVVGLFMIARRCGLVLD
jgi:two-component system response regulator EvgA